VARGRSGREASGRGLAGSRTSHSRTVPPEPAAASTLPRRSKARPKISSSTPGSGVPAVIGTAYARPVAHSRTLRSVPPAAISRPSGLYATAWADPVNGMSRVDRAPAEASSRLDRASTVGAVR
jgi:hypothetical protein